MEFKLTSFLKTSYSLSVVKDNPNGTRSRDRLVFDPNVTYDTTTFADVPNLETLINYRSLSTV